MSQWADDGTQYYIIYSGESYDDISTEGDINVFLGRANVGSPEEPYYVYLTLLTQNNELQFFTNVSAAFGVTLESMSGSEGLSAFTLGSNNNYAFTMPAGWTIADDTTNTNMVNPPIITGVANDAIILNQSTGNIFSIGSFNFTGYSRYGIGNYSLPASDGTNGQTLVTDGNGVVSWQAASGTIDTSSLFNLSQNEVVQGQTTFNNSIIMKNTNPIYFNNTDMSIYRYQNATVFDVPTVGYYRFGEQNEQIVMGSYAGKDTHVRGLNVYTPSSVFPNVGGQYEYGSSIKYDTAGWTGDGDGSNRQFVGVYFESKHTTPYILNYATGFYSGLSIISGRDWETAGTPTLATRGAAFNTDVLVEDDYASSVYAFYQGQGRTIGRTQKAKINSFTGASFGRMQIGEDSSYDTEIGTIYGLEVWPATIKSGGKLTSFRGMSVNFPTMENGARDNVVTSDGLVFTDASSTSSSYGFTNMNLIKAQNLNSETGGITKGIEFYDWSAQHTIYAMYLSNLDAEVSSTGIYIDDVSVNDDNMAANAWGLYVKNAKNVFFNDTYFGDTSETIDDGGFIMNGSDVFMAGDVGIEGNVYMDGNLTIKSNLHVNGDTYDIVEYYHTKSSIDALRCNIVSDAINRTEANTKYPTKCITDCEENNIYWKQQFMECESNQNCKSIWGNIIPDCEKTCNPKNIPREISTITLNMYEQCVVDKKYISEFEPGDVVCLDEQGERLIKKCTEQYDSRVIGVVSTSPAIEIGDTKHGIYPVALVGLVPVKTICPIEAGQELVTYQNGYAQKKDDMYLTKSIVSFNSTNVKNALDIAWNKKDTSFAIAKTSCVSGTAKIISIIK